MRALTRYLRRHFTKDGRALQRRLNQIAWETALAELVARWNRKRRERAALEMRLAA